jgi:hypothetical protein
MRAVVVLLALLMAPMVSANNSGESQESTPTDAQSNGQVDNGPDDGAQYPAPVWAGSDDDGVYVVVNSRFNSHDASWSGGRKFYVGSINEPCPLLEPTCPFGDP